MSHNPLFQTARLSPHLGIRLSMTAGFTLIELLVVISITSILVDILLPALGRARSVAQSVQCVSGTRQMLLGTALYSEDYRGKVIPFRTHAIWYSGGTITWPQRLLLDGYLSSATVFRCPSFASDPAQTLFLTADPKAAGAWDSFSKIHYGINHQSLAGSFRYDRDKVPGSSNTIPTAERDHIANPAETILITDAYHSDPSVPLQGSYRVTDSGFNPTGDTQVHPIHDRAASIAFMDGHATSVRGETAPYQGVVTGNLYEYLGWFNHPAGHSVAPIRGSYTHSLWDRE